MNRFGFLLGLVLPIWASLGIAQTDFWRQTNGPFGGSVYAIHVSPNGDVYAGTYGGGVFRSTNGGDSWIGVNNGLGKNRYLRSLAANSSGHIFAGTDGGIFRSTNAGENWSEINFGLTSRSTYALAVTVSGTLFAGTNGGGVFRSTDNGDNWVHASSGLASNAIRSLVIDRSGRILAGTQGYGIYRSTNNGDSWSLVGLMNVTVLSLAIDSTGTLFAGTALGGVYRSTNDGVSWSSVCLSGNNVYALAVNPSGYVFAAGFPRIYRSVDGGGHWYAAGMLSNSVYCISINRSNGNIYAGSFEGAYRSTDNGAGWTLVNTGLAATDARAVASNAQGVLYAAVDGGMFRTVDNGANWVQVNNELTDRSPLSLLILPNNQVFVGSYTGVFRSTDNGESWLRFYTGLPSYKPVSCLARDQSGYILAATGAGIFRSTDGAEHWSSISTGLASTDVRSIIVNTYGHLLAGTAGGGVLRSTNNGGSWTAVNTGLTTNMIQSLAVNSVGYIFAGTQSKGVFRSTDNGTSWTPISSGLPLSAYIHSIAVNSSGFIFACTFDGVFRSTDDGANWYSITSGLTNNYVRAIAFNSNGVAFAATGGNGVCRSVGSTFAPRIALDKASFSFAADSGFSLPSTQAFAISNAGGSTLSWVASTNSAWLNVTPTNGSLAEGESTFVNVGMNTTALVPGTHLDTVTIRCDVADNSPQKVPVTYAVSVPTRLVVSTQSVILVADSGGVGPQHTLTVSNSGVGTLRWQVVKQQPWLRVQPDGGLGNTCSTLISITLTDLNPGTYRDTLVITGTRNETGMKALKSPQCVPVSFTVKKATELVLDKWSMTFRADTGAAIPPRQTILVSNPGVGTLQWTAKKNQSWISLSPDGGTGNVQTVTLGIQTTDLGPGTYCDTIEILGTRLETGQSVLHSPQEIAVAYLVGVRALLSTNDSTLTFSADSGAIAPAAQSCTITNRGGGILWWSAGTRHSWLNVSPISDWGNSSTAVVSIVDTKLPPGTYADTVEISAVNKESGSEALKSPLGIAVSLTIGARARLIVDKLSLSFVAESGGILPDSATIGLSNGGAGRLRWSVSKTQPWLKVSPDVGTVNTASVHVWVSSTSLTTGTYCDTLTFIAEKMETGSSALNSPVQVSVVYRVFLNHPPARFSMAKPLAQDSLVLTVPPKSLEFRWCTSRDSDPEDTVSYEVHLRGIGLDTFFGGITDTTCVISCMHLFRAATFYSVWVIASDGLASVSSDTVTFRTSAHTTDVQQTASAPPTEFALLQNYPNPFNPSTTIRFEIPEAGHVSLKIYDVLGKEAAALLGEYLDPGIYSVQWDAGGFVSGTYFYCLRAGSFVQVKKLTLLR